MLKESIAGWNFYSKLDDFNIMTQKSILIHFAMDFTIEIVNLEVLTDFWKFGIYFYKDGGSAAIEFTPQVLENLQHKCIRFINYKR